MKLSILFIIGLLMMVKDIPTANFVYFYNKLPEKAKGLVYDFGNKPMTLRVIYLEVKNNTKLGKQILKNLGF